MNVQSLINLCANIVSHQRKGIGNGRQNVWHDDWEWSDEIRYNEHMGIYLVVFNTFANANYYK